MCSVDQKIQSLFLKVVISGPHPVRHCATSLWQGGLSQLGVIRIMFAVMTYVRGEAFAIVCESQSGSRSFKSLHLIFLLPAIRVSIQ